MAKQQTATNQSLLKQTLRVTAVSEYRPYANLNTTDDPYKLDFLFANDVVRYKCSCGEFRRLNATYFCRHCMALRCRSCVAHEVDSQYCQHCLEYILTIDPKFQMNKCASCYQCPFCQHLLSTSVVSMSPSITDNAPQDDVVKRICQLVCEFCRWSSETFIIEGSRLISNLADVEVQNSSRISELITFFKAISQKERTDKKKRRFHSRSGNTMDLLKKYGIDNTLSPKLFESLRARTTFHDKSSSTIKLSVKQKSSEELVIEAFKPAEPQEPSQLSPLDTSYYYSNDFNLEDISGIEQRLAQVETQPERVANFKPISKSLSLKRSLRCKECERNLSRSEYSPVSIRFKIQSSAYYHIPELRMRSDVYPIQLRVDEESIVEFTLQNQTLSQVKVKLETIADEDVDFYDLVLPPSELSLGPKDDTADPSHVPFNLRPLNETTQIIFQGLFKVGFYLKVKPKRKVENLYVKFYIIHDVMLMQNPRENEKTKSIRHLVKMSLGPVA